MARNSLEKGIDAAKKGNKLLARLHLLEAAERSPQDIACWLWLAWAAESPEDAMAQLQKALSIDPNHELARAGHAWASGMAEMTHEHAAAETIERGRAGAGSGTTAALSGHGSAEYPVYGSSASVAALPTPSHWEGNAAPRLGGSTMIPALGMPNPMGGGVDSGGPGLGAPTVPGTGVFPGSGADSSPWTDAGVGTDGERATPGAGGTATATAPAPAAAADGVREGGEADAPPPRDPNRKPVVLVVDDSPTVCKLVAITLSRRGYQVISASDGILAMDVISSNKPDLILLDITMPRLDGYKLCKLIKGHDETRHIPVIMLSGKDGFFDKARGKFAGCTSYITKPFDPESLIQEVEKFLVEPVA